MEPGGSQGCTQSPKTLGLEKSHVPIRKQQREKEGQHYLSSRWQPAWGPWSACSLGRCTAPLCWSFPERFPVQDIAMQTPPPQPLPAPQPYLHAGGCCSAHEMLMLEMRPRQHLSLPPSPWPQVMGGGWSRRGLRAMAAAWGERNSCGCCWGVTVPQCIMCRHPRAVPGHPTVPSGITPHVGALPSSMHIGWELWRLCCRSCSGAAGGFRSALPTLSASPSIQYF